MRPILKWLLALPVALLVVAGTSKPAEATPIVSIVPSFQNAPVGGSVAVDIVVSGLTEATGGFSLTLGFEPSILSGTTYTIGSGFGSIFDLSFGFGVPAAGFLDLFIGSTELPATLPGLQGTGFTMATITFQALADGFSPILMGNLVLSNADGSADLEFTSANGGVCVGLGPCPNPTDGGVVPEPATLALLGIGLLALGVRLRARQ